MTAASATLYPLPAKDVVRRLNTSLGRHVLVFLPIPPDRLPLEDWEVHDRQRQLRLQQKHDRPALEPDAALSTADHDPGDAHEPA
jgi:hypothetical protein